MKIPVALVDHGSAPATPTVSQSAAAMKNARSKRGGVGKIVIGESFKRFSKGRNIREIALRGKGFMVEPSGTTRRNRIDL
jgi:hypothetical protein